MICEELLMGEMVEEYADLYSSDEIPGGRGSK
jgi:hypothetical protein